jgi:hypothetical protein
VGQGDQVRWHQAGVIWEISADFGGDSVFRSGAPEEIRTPDPPRRKLLIGPPSCRMDGSTSQVTPLWQVDDGLVLNLLPAWAPDAAVRNPARLYEF